MKTYSKIAMVAMLAAFLPTLAFAQEGSALTDSANTKTTVSTSTTMTTKIHKQTWTGTVSSISGATLTFAAKNGATFSVDTTSAKLIRRYGATMLVSNIQTGDMLEIQGTLSGTTITAKQIRNISLQAHNGTFLGTVSAVSGSSFTLQSKARGTQTINTTGTTVFKIGSQSASTTSVAVGQTVIVSGIWDRTNSNIAATRITIKISAVSISGILQAISGTNLTVVASTTTYSIDVTKANIYYKNGRKGTVSLLQTNDQVRVVGKSITGSSNITAITVRDMTQTYKKPTAATTTTSSLKVNQ